MDYELALLPKPFPYNTVMLGVLVITAQYRCVATPMNYNYPQYCLVVIPIKTKTGRKIIAGSKQE